MKAFIAVCFQLLIINIYAVRKSGSTCVHISPPPLHGSTEYGSAQGLVILDGHRSWHEKDVRSSETPENTKISHTGLLKRL